MVNIQSNLRIPCATTMWEEGMSTKPQVYYNNKHASTPQASKRKKRQVRTITGTFLLQVMLPFK